MVPDGDGLHAIILLTHANRFREQAALHRQRLTGQLARHSSDFTLYLVRLIAAPDSAIFRGQVTVAEDGKRPRGARRAS